MFDLNFNQIQQVTGGVALSYSEKLDSYILILEQGNSFYLETSKTNGSYMFFDDGDIIGPENSSLNILYSYIGSSMTFLIPSTIF